MGLHSKRKIRNEKCSEGLSLSLIFFAKMEDKYDTIQGNLIFIEVIEWPHEAVLGSFYASQFHFCWFKVDLRSFVLLFLTELVLKDII